MPDSEIVHATKPDTTQVNLTDLSKASRNRYRAQAFKLFKKGFGYRTVSSMLRLSVYTVKDWDRLFKAGEFEPKLKHPGNCPENQSTKELRDKVKTEYENGASISSLSIKYGKNKSTIRYWVRKK